MSYIPITDMFGSTQKKNHDCCGCWVHSQTTTTTRRTRSIDVAVVGKEEEEYSY
jgi:hypothetical protein